MERPNCTMGYSWSQIRRILGPERMEEFEKWMHGQIPAVCDGQKYDYEAGRMVPTQCGPHGGVVYEGDFSRFMRGGIRRGI